jgi:hypothetical protein
LLLRQSAILTCALAQGRRARVNLTLTENHHKRHAVRVSTMDAQRERAGIDVNTDTEIGFVESTDLTFDTQGSGELYDALAVVRKNEGECGHLRPTVEQERYRYADGAYRLVKH